MAKICTFTAIIVVFWAGLYVTYAQEDLAKLKGDLNDLRYQMEEITNTYKNDMVQVRKESDKKIATLKKEFHKNRAQYIAERKAKEAELEAQYNQKVAPMKQKERELINTIEPIEPSNFAKKRY